MYKPLWDFMDSVEGREVGASSRALLKEVKAQGV